MSKWMVYSKRADFAGIGEKYGVDPVVARILRNRDIVGENAIERFMKSSINLLYNPRLLKDVEKAAKLIEDKIKTTAKIRIIGDYDIDGVCSIAILYKAFRAAGAAADYVVPDRISDGYGINERLIDKAYEDGIDTIVTCDNGIAAIDQIAYAKKRGMTVIVTDHHDIPFQIKDGEKQELIPEADAVVNPKQADCPYPFSLLCGAGVVYKLACVLYEDMGLGAEDLEEYRQLAAVATVGDIVELIDENRILVKYGLETMPATKNIGLRGLFQECGIELDKLTTFHIGFVAGPCLNASGRLDTAAAAVELLLETDVAGAAQKARKLCELNDRRKEITEEQAKKAIEAVESGIYGNDTVLVVYLPECHESVAGIIAGRLREYFYRPSIVITDAQTGAKGSGRSIEGYNMFAELTACRDLLDKFGGHPMAAGLSLAKENIDKLRKRLNNNVSLSQEQLLPVTWIDAAMPVGYVSFSLIHQLKQLEPFGKGNERPVFADRNLTVRYAGMIGKNRNVLKLQLETADGNLVNAVQFKMDGADIPVKGDRIDLVYYPDINEYMGQRSIQFVIKEWRKSR